MRVSILTVVLIGLLPATGHTKDVSIDCLFQGSSATSGYPDAVEWEKSSSFRRMKWVIESDAMAILDGPGKFTPPEVVDGMSEPAKIDPFWGKPSITSESRSIELLFNLHAKPLARSTQLQVSIDRFTGQASRTFSMLTPGKGRLVHWMQWGQCGIHERKM